METTVTAIEFARNLSDIPSRVRYKNEHFVIVRNGVRVAEVRPLGPPPLKPLSEVLERVGHLRMPGDGFADDLEAIRASVGKEEPPERP